MDSVVPDKVEFAAANSLVAWKHRFASLVKDKAVSHAVSEGTNVVTWNHYHEAASEAIIELSELIKSEQNPNERREAA